jgi:hypothetical protein
LTKKSNDKITPAASKTPAKKADKSAPLPINQAKLEEKLTKYLLNLEHPLGKHKAQYFKDMGYTLANWRALAKELKFDIDLAEKGEITKFGAQRFTQHIKINSADGTSSRIITTGWELKEGMKEIDLITAYPAHKEDV